MERKRRPSAMADRRFMPRGELGLSQSGTGVPRSNRRTYRMPSPPSNGAAQGLRSRFAEARQLGQQLRRRTVPSEGWRAQPRQLGATARWDRQRSAARDKLGGIGGFGIGNTRARRQSRWLWRWPERGRGGEASGAALPEDRRHVATMFWRQTRKGRAQRLLSHARICEGTKTKLLSKAKDGSTGYKTCYKIKMENASGGELWPCQADSVKLSSPSMIWTGTCRNDLVRAEVLELIGIQTSCNHKCYLILDVWGPEEPKGCSSFHGYKSGNMDVNVAMSVTGRTGTGCRKQHFCLKRSSSKHVYKPKELNYTWMEMKLDV